MSYVSHFYAISQLLLRGQNEELVFCLNFLLYSTLYFDHLLLTPQFVEITKPRHFLVDKFEYYYF